LSIYEFHKILSVYGDKSTYLSIFLFIISSSSIGATARYVILPVEKYLSIFPYLLPTLTIFSLPALEYLFLLST
jgi:hypothetical protein